MSRRRKPANAGGAHVEQLQKELEGLKQAAIAANASDSIQELVVKPTRTMSSVDEQSVLYIALEP